MGRHSAGRFSQQTGVRNVPKRDGSRKGVAGVPQSLPEPEPVDASPVAVEPEAAPEPEPAPKRKKAAKKAAEEN